MDHVSLNYAIIVVRIGNINIKNRKVVMNFNIIGLTRLQ